MAEEWSKLSYCKRRQVGSLIVKDKMIISDGYNGTPSGFENFCEDEDGYTKWYVLHAEANAILNSTEKLHGAKVYVALFPCNECAKLIIQSGIKEIVYLSDKYKDTHQVKASKTMLDMAKVKYTKLQSNRKNLIINFES